MHERADLFRSTDDDRAYCIEARRDSFERETGRRPTAINGVDRLSAVSDGRGPGAGAARPTPAAMPQRRPAKPSAGEGASQPARNAYKPAQGPVRKNSAQHVAMQKAFQEAISREVNLRD